MKNISMIKLSLPFAFSVILCYLFAQQTYNLEILFQKTAWDSSPDLYDYGISLAGGDMNDDGYSDIAIGASHWVDTLSWWAIDVYVFFGSPVMDTSYDAVFHCPPHFGHNESHLWIGDVTGDSIGDLVVGDLGGGTYGEVRVFCGGVMLDTLVDVVLHDNANFGAFGCAVAGGDVNGDNFNDIIVGSYTYSGLSGRVYVYYGGPLLDTIPDVIINGHNGEEFGISVGSGGDLDSDGFDDIVVGACENSESYSGAGKVYAFFGGNPMDTIPDCWLHGEGVSQYLGWFPVNLVINALTFSRIFTGTPMYPNGFPLYSSGRLYYLYGGDPMDTLVDWIKNGEDDSSSLGMASSSGGFASNDSNGEFVGGAPIGVDRCGKGTIWLGDSPPDTIDDAYIKGTTPIEIGWVVASTGDVNNDNYGEVMFSNYASNSNQTVWVCRYTGEGVEEENGMRYETGFDIFPNPFSSVLYIANCRRCKIENVKIYDVTGREVCHGNVRDEEGISSEGIGKTTMVNTKRLPAGVYFIAITEGGQRIVRKAVKVK